LSVDFVKFDLLITLLGVLFFGLTPYFVYLFFGLTYCIECVCGNNEM